VADLAHGDDGPNVDDETVNRGGNAGNLEANGGGEGKIDGDGFMVGQAGKSIGDEERIKLRPEHNGQRLNTVRNVVGVGEK